MMEERLVRPGGEVIVRRKLRMGGRVGTYCEGLNCTRASYAWFKQGREDREGGGGEAISKAHVWQSGRIYAVWISGLRCGISLI